MTRLLVTGGAGFIGSRICALARERGWTVRVLDALDPGVHASVPELPEGVELVRGSVTDPASVRAALAAVDVVSHQAAKVGLGVDFGDAPDYVATNVGGTAVLLAEMQACGVGSLVLASSMVVYGEGAYRSPGGRIVRPAPRQVADLEAGMFDPRDPGTGEPLTPALVDEDDAVDPRNVYATSKLAQEHLAANWARESGAAAIALRYHNVYGPGMPRDTPYAGVASIFRSALARGEAPQVFEDGRQRRSFIHVDDIAAANIAAVDAVLSDDAAAFRAFNVGSAHVHTIGDLAAALSDAVDGPPPEVTGRFRLGDVRHITASSERIREQLGWSEQHEFAAGMREFAHARLRD
ncbi:NAD-dependent epimerase/dehydratase family protein [Tersicoccus sp. MR15.9]|uniref:NAD-dependent epimerase/dehydratase family protein n=1 Tax=Tersicoccus mangrovi TaxID=3121635 RepID=UPI002FE53FE0